MELGRYQYTKIPKSGPDSGSKNSVRFFNKLAELEIYLDTALGQLYA